MLPETDRMPDQQAIAAAYQAAKERWLLAPLPGAGVVRLSGPDRLQFLSRLSTQNLDDLAPGAWRTSLLLNALGRLVDRLTVVAESDQLLLLTSPGRAELVRQWLAGYIFFQDDVAVAAEASDWQQWALLGPEADSQVGRWEPTLVRSPLGRVAQLESGYLWRDETPADGWRLLGRGPWNAATAAESGIAAAAAAWEALRVEGGLPAPRHELRPDLTPLEIGLRAAISFDKGCYIGQEIIARMDSRGQVPRGLWRLRLEGPADPEAEILQSGKTVGMLTSVAWSPASGWIALGLIQRRAVGDGPPSGLALADGSRVEPWQAVAGPASA